MNPEDIHIGLGVWCAWLDLKPEDLHTLMERVAAILGDSASMHIDHSQVSSGVIRTGRIVTRANTPRITVKIWCTLKAPVRHMTFEGVGLARAPGEGRSAVQTALRDLAQRIIARTETDTRRLFPTTPPEKVASVFQRYTDIAKALRALADEIDGGTLL